MNVNGAFWFRTYEGALNAELFIELLENMMKYRRKPIYLVLDSLPEHKTALVKNMSHLPKVEVLVVFGGNRMRSAHPQKREIFFAVPYV